MSTRVLTVHCIECKKDMKLTKIQQSILDRMAAGEKLIRSSWHIPARFWFDGEYKTFRAPTMDKLFYELKLVEKANYLGGLKHDMKLTEAGKALARQEESLDAPGK